MVYAARALLGFSGWRLVPIVPMKNDGHVPAAYSTWAWSFSSTTDHTQPVRMLVHAAAWVLVINESDMAT